MTKTNNGSGLKKKRGAVWLMLIVALQLLFLAGIACFHYSALWVGKEITLQTVPVDPRDQLYGDYVQLNYEINSPPSSAWKGAGRQPERGDVVYVLLAENVKEGDFEVVSVHDQKPSHSAGEVVLKGRVQYADYGTIRIHYGLEQYFVEENTGKALEERAGNLLVHVKVAPWGSAVIERIEL
ncbi:GDYXXLXY domain-containing protein [Paenibacillus silvisoli]|uniref:GDYXXLXY domain-containing protein n=1 Tax=Paenibacillus silvisoli TaxID=3110539 RepID=UPI002806007F|nr:GDYXXLXY domain-containing protein [Paenibacillus silvisoli]